VGQDREDEKASLFLVQGFEEIKEKGREKEGF